jgi:CRISPR system Cascade subunit CasD
MTSTLLLRLAATRQSWGGHGSQRWRPTERFPNRAGLEGLFHAALGLARGETDPRTSELEMHVRVDRAGTVEEDFHTVSAPPADVAAARQRGRVLRTTTGKHRADYVVPLGSGGVWVVDSAVNSLITRRGYLADAEFMVAATGPDDVITALDAAVRAPVFSPYLGRQSFAPQFPFHLGVRPGHGVAVLEGLPTTAHGGKVLPTYLVEQDRSSQVARLDPPRTTTPLIDWKP